MGGVREGFISIEEHEAEIKKHDMAMRWAMKDSIIGAIQDLHAGNNEVQVMMRWSREFYDEIQSAMRP